MLAGWLYCLLAVCLAGWLTSWLAGWLAGWLASWLGGWLASWLAAWVVCWDWKPNARVAAFSLCGKQTHIPRNAILSWGSNEEEPVWNSPRCYVGWSAPCSTRFEIYRLRRSNDDFDVVAFVGILVAAQQLVVVPYRYDARSSSIWRVLARTRQNKMRFFYSRPGSAARPR